MTESTILCKSCGAVIKPEARFCVKCGQVIPSEPQHPPQPINLPTPPPPQVPPQPGTPPPVTMAAPPVMPPPTQIVQPPPPLTMQSASIPQTAPIVSVNPPPPPPKGLDQQVGIPPLVPSSHGGETVLHVIGMVSRKTSMFSSIVYHMVLTSQRLIFALQTNEMQKADINDARQAAKAQGKGFLGQVGAQMGTRCGEKYLAWAPESILAENPQNFTIPLDQLKVIETYYGDFEDNAPDTMVIRTLSDKLTFIISSAYAVRGELKPFLGNRVK